MAETILRTLGPRYVLDAGCRRGLLVQAFRDRGVEAWGLGLSEEPSYEAAFCRRDSPANAVPGFYDLIVCLDALDHMSEHDRHQAIVNFCRATTTILFASSLTGFQDLPGRDSQPVPWWLLRFWERGLMPDLDFDASFAGPQAVLLRRSQRMPIEAVPLFNEVLRLRAELRGVKSRLEAMESSPGWQLIRKYREWIGSNRESRPWYFWPLDSAARLGLKGAGVATAALPGVAQSFKRELLENREKVHGSKSKYGAQFTYEDWIREQEPDAAALQDQRRCMAAFSYQPAISIVVPVFRLPLPVLKKTIGSVLAQTYSRWELCIAHADPDDAEARAYLARLAETDPRVKLTLLNENRGISANSNSALAAATGEFIGLLDHDDELAPFALYEVTRALNENPSIDFIYSDRDELTVDGEPDVRVSPLFKPGWSPEIMISANYLTHFNVIASRHLREIGGWRDETDGAQDWDLFFRVAERARSLHRIPKMLYHWRQLRTSTAALGTSAKPYAEAAQLRAVQDHIRRGGSQAEVEFDRHRRLHVKWPYPQGQKISVIVTPSLAAEELARYANHLLAQSTWEAEFVLPVAEKARTGDSRIRIAPVATGASLAERLNCAVEHSTGDILVFVDPAASPVNAEWLAELAGPLENRAIGIAGGKLMQSGSPLLTHAGLLFTEDHRLEYVFLGEVEDVRAEFGPPTWYRNWSCVAGTCFSIRRATLNAIGGFLRPLRYPRLDVDLCLRVRYESELRVVYNPYACWIQSAPGALEHWLWGAVSAEQSEAYLRQCFPDGDPYFHPKLTCRGGKFWFKSRANS
jgi:cellulose synthase/poly-beta-1,6-N-acetylglucosamine synthase-like glycosyltransferase